MNVNIKVFKSTKSTVQVGFGTVTFENFVNIRFGIINSNYGLRVSWPFDKYVSNGETKYENKVTFVNEDDKKLIDSNIIKEYNRIAGITSTSSGGKADLKFDYGENENTNQEYKNNADTLTKEDDNNDIPDIEWDTE